VSLRFVRPMIIQQLCYGMASDTRRESGGGGGQGGGCFDAIFVATRSMCDFIRLCEDLSSAACLPGNGSLFQ
jgi:hypothetical protein